MDKLNIATLRTLLEKNKVEPFIRWIRFPLFKNIEQDTKIAFTFPVTVLVGANGTNKSSVLRALQGSPDHSNLGNFWFSTKIDPIEQTRASPQCFIYGYYNEKERKIVEVLKTRISKENDPDYWEPSRAIIKYGMERFNPSVAGSSKSATRWDSISKKVVYIDFRQSLSAFDKYFYHSDKDSTRDRKAHIRKCAPHLADAIATGSKTYSYYRERIVGGENYKLSDDEVAAVSAIVGKAYSEIFLIRHTFFKTDAYTSVLRTEGLKYTEAFAGSGEFAAVRLVREIKAAEEKSLILLDEPEVSLHPGAQEKLMTFLLAEAKEKKHQLIISTHSPAMVRNLPPDAIKVFVCDPSTQKITLPTQESAPEEAFFHLGEPIHDKLLVVVEDALAKKIVKKALRRGAEAFATRFKVEFFPGGSKTLWKHYVPIFAAEHRSDVLVLLDGDERPSSPLPDPAEIPISHADSWRSRPS